MKSLELCLYAIAPGTDRSQSLNLVQYLAVQFLRGISVQVQFEKRFKPIFGSLQVRLRCGVKFTNTERVKRDFAGTREKTQRLSSTLGLYENTGDSRCVLRKGQVLELDNSGLFPLKQPTELCFLAFQSFQGSQGRAYLFNSV